MNVRLEGLQVRLPNEQVLFSLPLLEVKRDSHCLIEGASGAGKSTLLHLIAGLLRPSQGSVQVGDFYYQDKSENELCSFRRQNIGIVFQRLNLIEHLSIGENVALSMPAGATAATLERALQRLGLGGRGSDLCSFLSQGEQQRVAVARVLAAAPNVILADEPTSSLDDQNANFVIEALLESARKKTFIMVSHDKRMRTHFDKVLQFGEIIR